MPATQRLRAGLFSGVPPGLLTRREVVVLSTTCKSVLQAEGLAESSRGLSDAIPPVISGDEIDPERVAAFMRAFWHPSGVRIGWLTDRGSALRLTPG